MEKNIHPILDAGYKYAYDAYLYKRIRPTNVICLLVVFVLSIPFSVISLMYFPGMTIFPAGGGLISIIVLIINYYGGIYYSRLLLPITLLILSSMYNAYFNNSMSEGTISIYLCEMSFSLIPFVVFDPKEKFFLIFSGAFSLFILVGFPYFWPYFNMGYSGIELREGVFAVITVVLAFITQVGSVMGLVHIGKTTEKESNDLRLLAEEEKESLKVEKYENQQKTKELERAQEEERKRQWAAEGEAQVSQILRDFNNDEEQLYDKLISSIVKYLKANQGSLFVVDRSTEDIKIMLQASYAYGRKKYLEKEFEPGQGLIGQAYLEKQYIHLKDIPQGYINITSGLGEAVPDSLIIVPLIAQEEVQGMVEIASFKSFEEHEIDFLERLSEILASHIKNQKFVIQMKHVLESSQQQAEELRAQEEEMRQNMEEMNATQEEMGRIALEHETQMRAINQTMATITFTPEGVITEANQNFLDLMGYAESGIRGLHHRTFVVPEERDSIEYQNFWESLSKGGSKVGVFHRLTKGGKDIWLKGTYASVVNKEGKVMKVIKFAIDVTEQVMLQEKISQMS